jgi:DNA-binding MarR family transcriptional regulator
MDAVIFEVKGAHLALQRVGRLFLREHGLTPARFDLMHALGQKGIKQSDLWRRLNVVRSVVCEMVRALQALSWVKRVRAADGRTWLVMLTRRGREVFERAYACCVETGDVNAAVDGALADGDVQVDVMRYREAPIPMCRSVQCMFRKTPWFRGPDLYVVDVEDYCWWLTWPGEDPGDVPFVDDDYIATSLS